MEHSRHPLQDLTIDAKAFGISGSRDRQSHGIHWRLEVCATMSLARFSALPESARRYRFSYGRATRHIRP
ncbi:MAG: hypothetical protein OXN89_21095 [Bryobacterales bacterium]|nr:hypothetical protein [Bryobacterales bacterium]